MKIKQELKQNDRLSSIITYNKDYLNVATNIALPESEEGLFGIKLSITDSFIEATIPEGSGLMIVSNYTHLDVYNNIKEYDSFINKVNWGVVSSPRSFCDKFLYWYQYTGDNKIYMRHIDFSYSPNRQYYPSELLFKHCELFEESSSDKSILFNDYDDSIVIEALNIETLSFDNIKINTMGNSYPSENKKFSKEILAKIGYSIPELNKFFLRNEALPGVHYDNKKLYKKRYGVIMPSVDGISIDNIGDLMYHICQRDVKYISCTDDGWYIFRKKYTNKDVGIRFTDNEVEVKYIKRGEKTYEL